jgi:hypothetical protein
MGTLRSKGAFAVLAAGLALASPLCAQQTDEGAPLGQLIDSVRGFFGRIFSGAEQKPATPEIPAATPPPAQAPVAESAPPPASAPKPELQRASRNLHEAVVNGDPDAVRRLLDEGADIEAKDPGSGASPLHYAVMKGRMQIIDLLLSRNADVNSRTRNGTTPLHTAALYARPEVAERLIEQRADINAVSAGGSTPLALATAARNKPIAEMLRARGAK